MKCATFGCSELAICLTNAKPQESLRHSGQIWCFCLCVTSMDLTKNTSGIRKKKKSGFRCPPPHVLVNVCDPEVSMLPFPCIISISVKEQCMIWVRRK